MTTGQKRSGIVAWVAALSAFGLAQTMLARADDTGPAVPAVASPADQPPPPPPPAPQGPRETLPPPPTPPLPEPGVAGDLYPSVEQQYCDMERCLTGLNEIRVPLYDPTARFLIPSTGQWGPQNREWSVFAGETLTYDSNIFATRNNAQSDWISNTSVGGSYRREGSEYWTLATASLTYSEYLDHTNQSSLAFYGNFQFGWKGASMYASVADQVGYLQNPIVVRDNTFSIIDQNRDKYWTNDLAARVGYDCVKLRAELEYDFNVFYADSGVITAFNHMEHGVQGRVDYYVTEKTSVGAYAGVRFISYDDGTQRDFNVYSGGGTFSYRPTAKFGVTGMIGYSSTDSSGGGTNNSTFTGSIDGTWDATQNLTLFLGWWRRYEASLGADDQLVDMLRVRAQAAISDCWTLNGQAGVQIGDVQGSTNDGARDYTLWFFDVMVHHPLGDHWAVDGGYQFRKQDSSGSGIDFDDHRVTVGVTFAF